MIGFYPMGKRSDATKDQYVLKRRSNDPSYTRKMGNYPAKKYNKGTPAVTRLSFECTGPGTVYIDTAMALSAINRRLYRQGLYYYVNSVEYYDAQPNLVDIHTIPDTWMTRMALRRAKGVWDAMNDRALQSGASTILPKYHDFKVFANQQHAQSGVSQNPSLHSINQTAAAKAADDWDYSVITTADDDQDGVANADEFTMHVIGTHLGTANNWESIGIINSYAETRREPDSFDPVINTANLLADPLTNVVDFSSEEQLNDIMENLADSNDGVPYDANDYIGETSANLQHVARLSTHEGGGGRVSMGQGFCAPCGLIVVDPDNDMTSGNNFRIVLNLAVGTYHGVYAERI